MPAKLNNRTVGKIREAWPENKAIAELAIRVARLEEALREAEEIGDAAVREVESERDTALQRCEEAEEMAKKAEARLLVFRNACLAVADKNPDHPDAAGLREMAELAYGDLGEARP